MVNAIRTARVVIDAGYAEQQGVTPYQREVSTVWLLGASLFATLGALIFAVAALAYVGSLPREIPVPYGQIANGSYARISQPATENEAGTSYLLMQWIAACRLGSQDPKSMPAQQCSSLVKRTSESDSPFQQIRDYNQFVAEHGLQVQPRIYAPTHAGDNWTVNWDETVIASGGVTTINTMRAYLSVMHEQARVNLDIDPLNPFGLTVAKMSVLTTGVVNRAR